MNASTNSFSPSSLSSSVLYALQIAVVVLGVALTLLQYVVTIAVYRLSKHQPTFFLFLSEVSGWISSIH